MRLIGIHGKARSGKDEFCRILCETYGFKRIAFADLIRNLAIKYYGLDKDEVLNKKTKESRQILQGIGVSVRNNITNIQTLLDDPTQIKIGVSGFPTWVENIGTSEFCIEHVDLKRKLKLIRTILAGTLEMWTNEIDMFVKVSKGTDSDIWINYLLNRCLDNIVYVIPDVRFINEYKILQTSECQQNRAIKIFRIDKPKIEAGVTHTSETDLDDITGWDFKVVNEHKTDWRERLVLSATNMVRKFKDESFFIEDDLKKFKIRLEWM